jgi:hypothetical protein
MRMSQTCGNTGEQGRSRITVSQFLSGSCTLLVLCSFAAAPTHAQDTQVADREAVQLAVADYVDGFYQGDTTRFVRSVSPRVFKYGYAKRADGYEGMQMPYAQFMAFARGVQQGRNRPPENAPRVITILDVQDQTASAKLTAWWGTDYLLLAKEEGRWVITHVLWQTPPPEADPR